VIGGALALWIWIVVICALLTIVAPHVVGLETFSIRGASMEPAIPLGSLVAVVPDDNPAVGDVLSYAASNDVVVTHRLIGVVAVDGDTRFLMQGDANDAPDPVPLDPQAVIGRVQFAIPLLGYVAWLMSTPTGLVGLATGAGMLLVLLWLVEDIERERGERARLLLGRL
jgi:signal peptidase